MDSKKEIQVILVERDRLIDSIHTLEEKYRSGKVSKEDYQFLRKRYESKLKEVEEKLGVSKAEAMRGKRRKEVAPPRRREVELEELAPPREHKPRKKEIKIWLPFATLVLVLLNVAIFVLLQSSGSLDQAIYDYGMRPAMVLRGQGLHGLLTSVFMHANEWHLIGNMIYLLVFGFILERRIGAPKFLVIYFLAHFVAVMFDLAIRSGSWIPAVGASAAIMGVMGACFIGYPWSRAPLGFMIWIACPLVLLFLPGLVAFFVFFVFVLPIMFTTMTKLVSIWPFVMAAMAYQFIMGVQVAQGTILTGVAYWCHIAGFVAGMLLIFFLMPSEEEAEPRKKTSTTR